MNTRVLRLLADYFRRTFGVWPLLILVQVMQASAFWALQVDRIPLLGVVIASLTYHMAFESPYGVLRTLPIARPDLNLFRHWASVGGPAVFVAVCTGIAWLSSGDNGWLRPSLPSVGLYLAVASAALLLLALLPKRKGTGLFWAALGAVGCYGVPWNVLSPAGILTLAVIGALVLAIAVPRREEQRACESTRALHGWSLITADVARNTLVLSILAIAGVSVARLLYPLDAALPVAWVYVSAVAVAACLQTRRWIHATRLLRLLPINHHRLTLSLYAIVALPGITACLLTKGVHALVPVLGMDVPLYLLVVFLATPLIVIPWQSQQRVAAPALDSLRQWAALMQLAAFPLWSGSLCAFGGPALMPAWFLVFVATFAVGFVVASYLALLVGIRSPSGFERHAGPLGAPS